MIDYDSVSQTYKPYRTVYRTVRVNDSQHAKKYNELLSQKHLKRFSWVLSYDETNVISDLSNPTDTIAEEFCLRPGEVWQETILVLTIERNSMEYRHSLPDIYTLVVQLVVYFYIYNVLLDFFMFHRGGGCTVLVWIVAGGHCSLRGSVAVRDRWGVAEPVTVLRLHMVVLLLVVVVVVSRMTVCTQAVVIISSARLKLCRRMLTSLLIELVLSYSVTLRETGARVSAKAT